MNNKLTFNPECELDTTKLHYIVETCIENNDLDAEIIAELQKIYESSCWFSVISFAEKVIYG